MYKFASIANNENRHHGVAQATVAWLWGLPLVSVTLVWLGRALKNTCNERQNPPAYRHQTA